MVGEAHIHRGVQWSQGVETVMRAWPDQAFQGGCDSSSLGVVMILPQLSEYFGESHITSSINETCGLDDLPEYFPLHQAGGGRTYVDVLNFTITWEVTAQLVSFPRLLHVGSHIGLHVPSVPAHVAAVLSTHYTVGNNTICLCDELMSSSRTMLEKLKPGPTELFPSDMFSKIKKGVSKLKTFHNFDLYNIRDEST